MSDFEPWYSDADMCDWWNTPLSFVCPVCRYERGEHYDGFCPSLDESHGKLPPFSYKNGTIIIPNYSNLRGRYGVAYPQSKAKTTPTVMINDHTCPTCKNTRVSLFERDNGIPCWRCGNKL